MGDGFLLSMSPIHLFSSIKTNYHSPIINFSNFKAIAKDINFNCPYLVNLILYLLLFLHLDVVMQNGFIPHFYKKKNKDTV